MHFGYYGGDGEKEAEDYTPPSPSGGKVIEPPAHKAGLQDVSFVSKTPVKYDQVLHTTKFWQEILETRVKDFS